MGQVERWGKGLPHGGEGGHLVSKGQRQGCPHVQGPACGAQVLREF